ncbi:hypothetical protein LG314_04900 [Agrococcus terreus]|uniref:hypothetical protein n=1 Tax=Agrococcus terreus TaxID=574649 RepID=UPI00384D4F90
MSDSEPERADLDCGGSVADDQGADDSPPRDGATDPRRWPVASRVVRVVGIALLMVPVVLENGWPDDLLRREALGAFTIVVGDWVPSLRGPAGWSFLLGAIALIIAPMLGSWGQGPRSLTAMRIISPVALGILVLTAANSYLGIWVSQEGYRVLEQPSPSGCRVVVAAHGAGFQGMSRSFGFVRPDSDRVEWVIRESYSEEGAHLIDAMWDGEIGQLRSDMEAQITPQLAPVRFDCRS